MYAIWLSNAKKEEIQYLQQRKYWNRTKLSSGKLSNISCYNYLKSNLKADVTVPGCPHKTVSLFLVYWVFGKEDRKHIGLQVSSKHSSTHRLEWIMATKPDVVQTVQYFLLWNMPISTLELQRTWHLTGHWSICSLEVWLLVRSTCMDLFLIRHVWQFVQRASTKWKSKHWMASNPSLQETQTFNHK